MSEVKRYTLWMVSESGCELEPYSEESPDGLYVHHADYAAIEAECDHLKACQENAQLHITGLVAERNAALRQRDKLAELLREAKAAYTTAIHWTDMRATMAKIDAALSELTHDHP